MDQRILQIIQKHPELKPEFEEIYPELKDSEDEKIRKILLRCCDDWEKGQFGCMAKEDVPVIRAYLEKQKEQKPAVEQLDGTFNSYDMAKTFVEGQYYVMEHPERFGLCKPAEWSEEDETCLECVLWCVMKTRRFVAKDACDLDACQRAERWLKSLCPQPKAEWSKEDDAAHTRIIGALAKVFGGILPTKPLEEDIEWFKSLPERFNLQPKQEWSEEDEYVIDKVIEWAKIVNPTSTIFEKIPKEQFIKRLKSLHPQPEKNWKRYIWNVNMRFDYGALVKYDDHYGFEIVTSGGKPKREVNGEYIFLKDICSTSY